MNNKREAIDTLMNFTKLDAVFYYTAPFAAEATLYVVRLLSGEISTSHLAVESELVDVTECVHAIVRPAADEDVPAYVRRLEDAVNATTFLDRVAYAARPIRSLRVPAALGSAGRGDAPLPQTGR